MDGGLIMPKISFLASFEDRSKIEKIRASMVDAPDYGDDIFHNLAQLRQALTVLKFDNLDAAVAWGRERVEKEETFYGLVEIQEYEMKPYKERCKYCICHGDYPIRHHLVSETGIDETCEDDDPCCGD